MLKKLCVLVLVAAAVIVGCHSNSKPQKAYQVGRTVTTIGDLQLNLATQSGASIQEKISSALTENFYFYYLESNGLDERQFAEEANIQVRDSEVGFPRNPDDQLERKKQVYLERLIEQAKTSGEVIVYYPLNN